MALAEEPIYIARREEERVLDALRTVRLDGVSRAVLLYGPGGVGKTQLVRAMAERREPGVVRVPPIDVDDSEYWVQSNLEQEVAARLDRKYFASYFDYLAQLPRYTNERVGHETVAGHFGRVREQFADCYRGYVEATGTTVVITLDTVEAVRTMYLLMSLAQWMKGLPRTLFILSGRPPGRGGPHDLIDDHLGGQDEMETTSIDLAGFTEAEALAYFDAGPLRDALDAAEKDRLVALTDGHPLWLALSVDYLQGNDPPPEMDPDPAVTPELREEFRRRMVTPYRDTGFWTEAVKRLAVVRQSVNHTVWRRLMSDHALPDGVRSWDDAWRRLLNLPWVRPRANDRYVTLHDALAEELAQRLIPLDDQDETWRAALWARAMDAYSTLAADTEARVRHNRETCERLQRTSTGHPDPALAQALAQTEVDKRELDQLNTAELHYRLLVDFDAGTERFLALYAQAAARHDLLFQELLCHELERFLPRARLVPSLDDVLGVVVRRFQDWLTRTAPERYLEIVLRIAGFLTQNEQPTTALALLSEVPDDAAGPDLRYRLANQRGNACLRIPDRIDEAWTHFDRATQVARSLHTGDRDRLVAQAKKEFGYFYRNIGKWEEADKSYREARDTLSHLLGPGCTDEDREEMASIQTNWAYLQALRGRYVEARSLVESAIRVRVRLDRPFGVGQSLSVAGEVYRYDHEYQKAWQAYSEAESTFQSLKNITWLGLVYQEQAICLFQAARCGVTLAPDPIGRARTLIRQSLDICRDVAIRSYPSALNRAGRIFGHDDPDLGLRYLDQAIVEARRVGDGWFLSANLIEYMELSYRVWTDTGDHSYRLNLDARASEVVDALRTYQFRDLRGRWALMQGHLLARDALADGDRESLGRAVHHYSEGFSTLADLRLGSHGADAIPAEFDRFQEVYDRLPADVQSDWYEILRRAWTSADPENSLTLLSARLEQLY